MLVMVDGNDYISVLRKRVKLLQVGFVAMFVVIIALVCLVLFKPAESATSSGTCLPENKGGTNCDSSVIKSMYESNADTNVFTDADKANLNSLLAASSDSGTVNIAGQPFNWYIRRTGKTRRVSIVNTSAASIAQGRYLVNDFLDPGDIPASWNVYSSVYNGATSSNPLQVAAIGALTNTGDLYVNVLNTVTANQVVVSFFYDVP